MRLALIYTIVISGLAAYNVMNDNVLIESLIKLIW